MTKMIRAEQQGVVFFHNPKAAGGSINHWFLSNIPGCRHVVPQHLLPTMIPKTYDWSFCVVRNPWERWVSWWDYWRSKLKRIDLSFEEYSTRFFAGEFAGLPGGENSPCHPQVFFSNHVDYVMRYENLNDDFKVVQRKMNCFVDLPLTNKRDNPVHYTYHYTDKLINLIADVYQEDIAEFGYEYGT